MEKHKMAGLPVKITSGPFKDKYFIVIDFIVNQYQGKTIEKIYKSHPAIIDPVKKRMGRLDDQIVFGKLHPSMEFCCMHDSELQVAKAELPILDNVVDIKQGAKNASRGPSEGDNKSSEPGESEPEGRSIPSGAEVEAVGHPVKQEGETTSKDGGNAGGSQKRPPRRKKQ